MTCPKCQGSMRQYERNGVTIDQCTECRGVFLDRGELERLVDAEAAFHATPTAAPAAPVARPAPEADYRFDRREHRGRDEYRGRDENYGRQEHYGHQEYGHRGHKKKRKSFFEELFED